MTQKLMKAINVVVILFLINILWFFGTIIGGLFLGFVPSTAALIHLLLLPELFQDTYSYKEIVLIFIKRYWQILKEYTWRVVVVPFSIIILYFDVLIIQQNSLMKALFQWPLILFMGYMCLTIINYFILDDSFPLERNRSKLKFSMAVVFLLPLQSLTSAVLFLCFFVIGLAYSWFLFFAIPLFVYVITHLFLSALKKKRLVS